EDRAADLLRLAALLFIDIAAVDPHLHPDHAIGRACLGKTVVDIRAERVQRQPPLQIPLRARDLVAVQAAGDADFNTLAAEAQRRIDRHAHDAAETRAL